MNVAPQSGHPLADVLAELDELELTVWVDGDGLAYVEGRGLSPRGWSYFAQHARGVSGVRWLQLQGGWPWDA